MAFLKRALRTFDTSTLTANFQNVGAEVDFASLQATFVNTSSVDILVTDGSSEDDIRVPAGGTFNITAATRTTGDDQETNYVFRGNVQLQAKQVTAAAAGTLTIMLFG
jgi:hypothetical protein